MDRFGRGQIELNKNLMDVVKGKTTEGGVEKAAVFSEKGIREGLGKQADELFKSLAKGDFGKAGEAGSDIVNEGYKMIKQIGLNAEQVYKTSEFGNIMRGDEKKTTAGQTATVSTEKTEIMSYLDKLQKQVQTPTTQNLNYSGNLNVTFSAPPGVNTTEVERVLNELMKKPEFIQMIAQMAKDPTGKQNPSQQNMNFGR